MNNNSAIKMKRKIGQSTLLIIACLVLGLLTTYTYVTYSYVSRYGIQYLETGDQIQRQQAVLEGHAGNPWQYRVFAVYLVRMVFNLFKVFQIPHYIAVSFIFVRVIQDTIILILSFLYLKEFRLSTPLALSGLVLIAWGMSSAVCQELCKKAGAASKAGTVILRSFRPRMTA